MTASLWPMDINSWVSTFYDVFHMDVIASRLMYPMHPVSASDYTVLSYYVRY